MYKTDAWNVDGQVATETANRMAATNLLAPLAGAAFSGPVTVQAPGARTSNPMRTLDGFGSGASFVIAAHDAPTKQKNIADYVCTGVPVGNVGDEAIINAAFAALPAITGLAHLGVVQLTAGTFNTMAPVVSNLDYVMLLGAGRGQLTRVSPQPGFSGPAAVIMGHYAGGIITAIANYNLCKDITVKAGMTIGGIYGYATPNSNLTNFQCFPGYFGSVQSLPTVVNGNPATQCGIDGIWIVGSQSGADCCTVENSSGHGIVVTGGQEPFQLDNTHPGATAAAPGGLAGTTLVIGTTYTGIFTATPVTLLAGTTIPTTGGTITITSTVINAGQYLSGAGTPIAINSFTPTVGAVNSGAYLYPNGIAAVEVRLKDCQVIRPGGDGYYLASNVTDSDMDLCIYEGGGTRAGSVLTQQSFTLATAITSLTQTVSACTNTTTSVTVTVTSTAGYAVGESINITGITGFTTNNPNGTFVLTALTSTTLTYTVINAPTGVWASGGTINPSITYVNLNIPVTLLPGTLLQIGTQTLTVATTQTTATSQYGYTAWVQVVSFIPNTTYPVGTTVTPQTTVNTVGALTASTAYTSVTVSAPITFTAGTVFTNGVQSFTASAAGRLVTSIPTSFTPVTTIASGSAVLFAAAEVRGRDGIRDRGGENRIINCHPYYAPRYNGAGDGTGPQVSHWSGGEYETGDMYGIFMNYTTGTTISGIDFYDNAISDMFLTNNNYLVVEDVYIYYSKWPRTAAQDIWHSLSSYTDFLNVRINGVNLESSGIRLDATSYNCTISHCKIIGKDPTNYTAHPIYLNGAVNCIVDFNHVDKSIWISNTSSGNVIHNNILIVPAAGVAPSDGSPTVYDLGVNTKIYRNSGILTESSGQAVLNGINSIAVAHNLGTALTVTTASGAATQPILTGTNNTFCANLVNIIDQANIGGAAGNSAVGGITVAAITAGAITTISAQGLINSSTVPVLVNLPIGQVLNIGGEFMQVSATVNSSATIGVTAVGGGAMTSVGHAAGTVLGVAVPVTGSAVPANTFIVAAAANGSSITLSQNLTATATGATFQIWYNPIYPVLSLSNFSYFVGTSGYGISTLTQMWISTVTLTSITFNTNASPTSNTNIQWKYAA